MFWQFTVKPHDSKNFAQCTEHCLQWKLLPLIYARISTQSSCSLPNYLLSYIILTRTCTFLYSFYLLITLLACLLACLFTYCLPGCLPHSLTYSLTHSLTQSINHCHPPSLTHLPIRLRELQNPAPQCWSTRSLQCSKLTTSIFQVKSSTLLNDKVNSDSEIIVLFIYMGCMCWTLLVYRTPGIFLTAAGQGPNTNYYW